MSLASLLLSERAKAQTLESLAVFAKTCPPPDSAIKPISKVNAEKALTSLYEKIKHIVREHRFGIIRRASIAKFVQDEMLARGYPSSMVSVVTHAITANALVK